MGSDEESECLSAEVTKRRIGYTPGIENEMGDMARMELRKSESDDDEIFELETREGIFGRERVSQDTEGANSSVYSTPRKAKRENNQKRMRIGRRVRQVRSRHIVNDVAEDTDSSCYDEQETLMSPAGLSTDHYETPSSVEESVCTEVKLPHQTPQKMLLEGYGEEVAEVDDWEFPCAWDNRNLVQGHLYICHTSVVFVGDNFGKMAETQIHYIDIVKINKGMSNLFVPNAIIFKIIDSAHIFRHFWNRDKCFERIMEAKANYKQQIESKTGRGGDCSTSEGNTHGSLISPHSPTTIAHNTMFSGGDRTLVSKSAPVSPLVTYSHIKDVRIDSIHNSQKKKENSQQQAMDDASAEPDGHLKWNDSDVDEAQRNRQFIDKMVDTCDGGGNYNDVVTAELPVSVEDFYRSFICDDAPYSIVMFHFARGDWEVDPTTWRRDVDLDIDGTLKKTKYGDKEAMKRSLYRVIRFKTPLSVQFIKCPSQVRTAKRQRLVVFGGAGIVYDTVTSVEDRIILSGNFHVEDRWVVQPSGESNERCIVSVKYRVVWKKSTVLKGLIESKVRSDVTSFNTAFADGMREYLTGAHAHMGSALQRRTSERAKPLTITISQTIKSVLGVPQIVKPTPSKFVASVGPITMVLAALCMMYFASFWLHFQLLNTGPFTSFVPSTCRSSLILDSRTSAVLPSLLPFDDLYINLGEAHVALRVALHQQVELRDAISATSSGSECDEAVTSAAITTSMKDVQEALSRMESVINDIYSELASMTSVKQGSRK